MIKHITNYSKWSNQYKFTQNFIGKSLFLLSLLPIALRILHVFELLSSFETIYYKLIFLGAFVFMIGYVLSLISMPAIIREFPKLVNYVDDCVHKIDVININLEFSVLSENYCTKKYQRYDKVFGILKDYLPIDETIQRVSQKKAIAVYSRSLYQIQDHSYTFYRSTIAVIIISGFLLMNSVILLSIYNLIGEIF